MPEGERAGPMPGESRQARERIYVGIVLERRRSSHPWQDHFWRAVAVLPGGGPAGGWRPLRNGPGWEQFYAGSLPLTLYAGETEGYGHNLMAETPKVFVVLRGDESHAARDEPRHEVEPFLVTVCPFEAQDYLDSGEQPVEALPMPEMVRCWVQAFVDRHHVSTPLKKRRKRSRAERREDEKFVRRPAGTGEGSDER